jgi:threonine dehydratase
MVGGHVSGVGEETVMSFEFPEKPGALKKFLTAISGRWNITLFHYRNHGADHGHVLAGMQVPVKERKEFLRTLKALGYSFRDVTDNPAYRLFLGNRD